MWGGLHQWGMETWQLGHDKQERHFLRWSDFAVSLNFFLFHSGFVWRLLFFLFKTFSQDLVKAEPNWHPVTLKSFSDHQKYSYISPETGLLGHDVFFFLFFSNRCTMFQLSMLCFFPLSSSGGFFIFLLFFIYQENYRQRKHTNQVWMQLYSKINGLNTMAWCTERVPRKAEQGEQNVKKDRAQ